MALGSDDEAKVLATIDQTETETVKVDTKEITSSTTHTKTTISRANNSIVVVDIVNESESVTNGAPQAEVVSSDEKGEEHNRSNEHLDEEQIIANGTEAQHVDRTRQTITHTELPVFPPTSDADTGVEINNMLADMLKAGLQSRGPPTKRGVATKQPLRNRMQEAAQEEAAENAKKAKKAGGQQANKEEAKKAGVQQASEKEATEQVSSASPEGSRLRKK